MENDFLSSFSNAETQRIDATLRNVVSMLAMQTGQKEFRFVLVALRYREVTGIPLKVDVAKALGLPPSMPSQALHYVQSRKIKGLEYTNHENELYIRLAPGFIQGPSFSDKDRQFSDSTASRQSKTGMMGIETIDVMTKAATEYIAGKGQKESFGLHWTEPKSNALESFAYLDYPSLLQRIADSAEPEKWGVQNWALKYRLRGLFAWLYNRWAESPEAIRGRYLHIETDSVVMPLGLCDTGKHPMYLVMTRNRRAVPVPPWFANGNSVAAFCPPTPMSHKVRPIAQNLVWPSPDLRAIPIPECTSAVLDEWTIATCVLSHLALIDDTTLQHLCSVDKTVEGCCHEALAWRQQRNQAAMVARGGLIPQPLIQATTVAFQRLTECIQRTPVAQQEILRQVHSSIVQLGSYLEYKPRALSWQSSMVTQLLVPSYNQRADYPGSTHYMGCMVPLALDAQRPCMPSLAIVIAHDERQGSSRVQTCLSLEQAYAAARVIGPVSSSWLTSDVLSKGVTCSR